MEVLLYLTGTQNHFMVFFGNKDLKELMMAGSYANWTQVIGFKEDKVFLFPYASTTIDNKYYSFSLKDSSFEIKNIMEDIRSKGDTSTSLVMELENLAFTYYPSDEHRFFGQCWIKYDRSDFNECHKEYDNEIKRINEKLYKSHIACYENETLFATTKGLYLLRGDKVLRYFSDAQITGIIRDRESHYWITVLGKGIYKVASFDIQHKQFDEYLSTGDRFTCFEFLDDKLILGTSKGLLFSYSDGKGLVELARTKKYVHNLIQMGNSVIGSHGYEISKIGSDDLRTDHREIGVIDPIMVIKRKNGNIVSFDAGIDRILISNRLGNTFHIQDSGNNLHERIWKIFESDNEDIYITTLKSVYKINNSNFRKEENVTKRYDLDENIRDIVNFHDGGLLMASIGGGVQVIFNDSNYKITTEHGLISNMVDNVLLGSNNSIWCGSNEGLNKINYSLKNKKFQIESIISITREEGMLSDYIIDILMKDGRLWILSGNGLTSFKENKEFAEPVDPNVFILRLNQGEEEYVNEGHVFQNDENNFQFDFLGISSGFNNKLPSYRFRLNKDGAKDRWVYTSNRSALFNDLRPGDYTFELSAKAINTDWTKPKTFSFSVKPSFFERTDVRIVLIFLALISVILIYKWSIRRMKKDERKKRDLDQLKLKLNELELAVLRGQMNPHFVYNALSSIQKMVLTDDKKSANEHIVKFSSLMRSSLKYSRLDFITLDDEIKFLSNYLDIEVQRFKNLFDYQIKIDPKLDTANISIPPLMIQPICENAVKHAFEEQNGTLSIDVNYESDFSIKFTVTDNGKGYFNSTGSAKNESIGLKIVKGRIELLVDQGYEASIHVEPLDSITRKGTVVDLIIPIE